MIGALQRLHALGRQERHPLLAYLLSSSHCSSTAFGRRGVPIRYDWSRWSSTAKPDKSQELVGILKRQKIEEIGPRLMHRMESLVKSQPKEELEEKLSFLRTSLDLSSTETKKLITYQYSLLDKSIDELKERILLFQNEWHCDAKKLKEIFLTERIQKQSLPQLYRMKQIYSTQLQSRLPAGKDNLLNRLTDIYWWKKYQAFLMEENNDNNNNNKNNVNIKNNNIREEEESLHEERLQVKEFFQTNKYVNYHAIGNFIDKIVASKILVNDTRLNIQRKIRRVSYQFQFSKKDLTRVICIAPNLFNESLQILDKRINYFKVILGCSNEEIQYLYSTKLLSVGMQPTHALETIHILLEREYKFETKDIKSLILRPRFSFARFHEMITDFVERKYYLQQLFSTPASLIHSLLINPSLLWTKPEELEQRVSLFGEAIQAKSLDDLIPLFKTSALVFELDKIKMNSEQILSLFTFESRPPTKSATRKYLDPLTEEKRIKLQKAFQRKYNFRIKQAKQVMEEVENLQKIEELNHIESSNKVHNLTKLQKMENARWCQIHEAFLMEKSKKRDSNDQSSLDTVLEIATAGSTNDIVNPYHRLIREVVDDLMINHSKDNQLILKDQLFCREIMIYYAKEIEKFYFTFDEARDICINGYLFSNFISSIFPKLITLSAILHLSHNELMSIIERCPRLFKENPLPKLFLLAQFSEEYHQKNLEKATTEEDTLHNWMKSIKNAKNITEAKEIYRNHPTITLVRESILRNAEILRKSIPSLNDAIKDWENLPVEERNGKNFLSFNPVRKN